MKLELQILGNTVNSWFKKVHFSFLNLRVVWFKKDLCSEFKNLSSEKNALCRWICNLRSLLNREFTVLPNIWSSNFDTLANQQMCYQGHKCKEIQPNFCQFDTPCCTKFTFLIYRTRAIITCSWFETALNYKPRIFGPTFLVYVLKLSVILTSLDYKPHCKMG